MIDRDERPRAIVSGFLHDGLGLAEGARGSARALVGAGFEVGQYVLPVPDRPAHLGHPGDAGLLDLPQVGPNTEADVVVVCVNPPEIEVFRGWGLAHPAGRVNIGVWAWEVDPLPIDWAHAAGRFDEIWVNSQYVADIVRPAVGIPVAVVPPALELPDRPSTTDRSGAEAPSAGADGAPVFVTMADVASSLARKNPRGSIEAFCRAFEPGEGPRLVVKLWNGHLDPGGVAVLREAARGRSDITIVDEWLPRDELVNLVATADCVVSLHRAEGFGLVVFEALAYGVPVVATAFSGPMDLLDERHLFGVRAEPTSVAVHSHPYPAGATWCEPDLDDAAAQLRAVWRDPLGARMRAEVARGVLDGALDPVVVGRAVRERLAPLLRARASCSPRSPLRPHVSVVAHAAGPWPDAAPFLRSVFPEIEPGGRELVLGVTDAGVVPESERPPGVRVVVSGSTSPFALRAAALDCADGDLVVVTEDHCRPARGWLDHLDAAHRDDPTAVLAGAVGNGATRSRADWANYLASFAAFAPPLRAVPDHRMPAIANCALPVALVAAELEGSRARPAHAPGRIERDILPAMRRADRVRVVPDAVVDHVQSFPGWRHVRNHFDDARTAGAAGATVARPRLASVPERARELLRTVVAEVTPHPELVEPHRRAARWLRALAAARALGEWWGARLGEGGAGERLD